MLTGSSAADGDDDINGFSFRKSRSFISYFCKASLKMKEPVQTLCILAFVTLMNVSMVLLQFEKDGL